MKENRLPKINNDYRSEHSIDVFIIKAYNNQNEDYGEQTRSKP